MNEYNNTTPEEEGQGGRPTEKEQHAGSSGSEGQQQGSEHHRESEIPQEVIDSLAWFILNRSNLERLEFRHFYQMQNVVKLIEKIIEGEITQINGNFSDSVIDFLKDKDKMSELKRILESEIIRIKSGIITVVKRAERGLESEETETPLGYNDLKEKAIELREKFESLRLKCELKIGVAPSDLSGFVKNLILSFREDEIDEHEKEELLLLAVGLGLQ